MHKIEGMTSFASELERGLGVFLPGGKILSTRSLTGGISAAMTAIEVELPGGERQKLISRQPSPHKFATNPRVAEEEFRVLTSVKEAGLPVQTPYFYIEPADGAANPYFIVEYVEGSVVVSPNNPSDFLEKYARQLAQIHRVNLDQLNLPPLPAQSKGYGAWPEVPNEELGESEIRRTLESVTPITQSNPPVLRHGDLWPGNILWREGEIVAVIDWEEALIGEPLADVAISRLDIWWVLGEAAADEFTERYFSHMPLDATDLPYWDLCASLRPITNIHEWSPSYPSLGRPDVTTETMSRDHRRFVERALRDFRR